MRTVFFFFFFFFFFVFFFFFFFFFFFCVLGKSKVRTKPSSSFVARVVVVVLRE